MLKAGELCTTAAKCYPVAWKRGGGSDLGIVGATITADEDTGKITLAANGIPKWWGPDTTKQWFTRQGFEVAH